MPFRLLKKPSYTHFLLAKLTEVNHTQIPQQAHHRGWDSLLHSFSNAIKQECNSSEVLFLNVLIIFCTTGECENE